MWILRLRLLWVAVFDMHVKMLWSIFLQSCCDVTRWIVAMFRLSQLGMGGLQALASLMCHMIIIVWSFSWVSSFAGYPCIFFFFSGFGIPNMVDIVKMRNQNKKERRKFDEIWDVDRLVGGMFFSHFSKGSL